MTTTNEQLIRAYLDAVAAWNLDDASAGNLIGVEAHSVREWHEGQFLDPSEEVLARMMMVAQIRTALDIYWSKPLSSEWINRPNAVYPYHGLSPVAYIAEHGWPGLYWVLRQAQAWAVGNY